VSSESTTTSKGPRPFLEGARRAASRGLLPTSLGSRELALRLDGEVKRAAMFSARVEQARVLQRLRDVVAEVVRGVTPQSEALRAAGEAPVLLSVPDAKLKIQRELDAIGYQAAEDEAGTIKDLRSDARLSLMVETNEALTHGHGRWVAAQDADLLDAFPAWELVRISPASEPRNWALRWMMAGGTTYGGRMIALKGSPVWDGLGNPRLFDDALGNPYPPFAFNSGMDVRDVGRQEAESLGLISRGAAAPAPDARALDEGMEVSAGRFDDAMRTALESDPDLVLDGGVLRPRSAPAPA
jgi:hypothetical protein